MPDALAGALERLAQDNTAISGGAWATHLFVINPTGDHSVRGSQPTPEQMKQTAAACAASQAGGAGANRASAPVEPDAYSQLKPHRMTPALAPFRRCAQAAAPR